MAQDAIQIADQVTTRALHFSSDFANDLKALAKLKRQIRLLQDAEMLIRRNGEIPSTDFNKVIGLLMNQIARMRKEIFFLLCQYVVNGELDEMSGIHLTKKL